jgi:integrase
MLLNAAGQRGEHLETFFVCCSKAALTSAQYRSPLGRRPYDLRHAAASLWLNSVVPATEVARRAGHGVAVLLKIYALGTTEPEPGPGEEGDADSEPAA